LWPTFIARFGASRQTDGIPDKERPANPASVPTPGTLLELLHATVQSKVKGAPTPTLPHVILHTSRLGNSLAAD